MLGSSISTATITIAKATTTTTTTSQTKTIKTTTYSEIPGCSYWSVQPKYPGC
jgi:hypothetical protein